MFINVKVTMKDLLEDTIIERIICASNASSSCGTSYKAYSKDQQAKNLQNWIDERANDQHETLLELVDFEFLD